MIDIQKLIVTSQAMWANCSILPKRSDEVTRVARRLVAPSAKTRYVSVSGITGIPWWVIAVIHEREAGQAWWANIAQGDPWNSISTHKPRGRGPFKSWEEAAIDALTKTPVFTLSRVNLWQDWTAGGTLVLLEMYNGFGYELYHHENSPYIWGATNHQERGKYIADGCWSSTVWDQQLGCAAMLKRMQEMDSSITMDGGKDETAVVASNPSVSNPTGGSQTPPSSGSTPSSSG